MAILKNSPLGTLSGKIGSTIYRVSKGKVIVAVTPGSYTLSQTPNAVRTRNILYSYSKFSSAVNKIPPLARIWNQSDLKGSTSYRKIVNLNSKKLNGEFLSVNNLIAPISIKVPVKTMSLESDKLDVILLDNVFEPAAKDFNLHLLLTLIRPKKTKTAFITFKNLFKMIEKEEFSVSFTLDKNFIADKIKYNELIVYPCLTFSENGSLKWFTGKGNLFSLK